MIAFEGLPPLSTGRFVMFSAAVLIAALVVVSFEFVPILDHINLAFHEAGHPIFGLFGTLMGWLGGTLAQFVFPLATTFHFARSGQWLSAAACAIWGFENLRYVAFYLGDARAQALPLVGGGEHDWAYLLGRFGMLEQDTAIAGFLTFVSWSGWLAVWGAVALWWWRSRHQSLVLHRSMERARIIDQARDRARAGADASKNIS